MKHYRLTAPVHRATDMHPGKHPRDCEHDYLPGASDEGEFCACARCGQEVPEPREEAEQMTMTVEVKVNERVIASASVVNLSGLADYSDYSVVGTENAHPGLGTEAIAETWQIEAHPRRQSAWALVEKIAAAMRLFQAERKTGRP